MIWNTNLGRGYFDQALSYTLGNEGGYVDDPDDAGGPTNRGITIATLGSWRLQRVTHEDIKNMTDYEVAKIYYARHWIPLHLNDVTQPQIAIALFDCGVLFGTGTAAVYAQKALVDCSYDLTIDGFLGDKSMASLNAVKPAFFLKAFSELLLSRIVKTVANHPPDKKFKHGWENRVNRYLTLV